MSPPMTLRHKLQSGYVNRIEGEEEGATSATLSQAFAHLLGNILGQAGCRQDTVQFRLHHAAPLFTISAPAAKRRHKTGSRLRIELIERNNGVGHKPVALPRNMMETVLIDRERAIKRPPTVGIGEREALVRGKLDALVNGIVS